MGWHLGNFLFCVLLNFSRRLQTTGWRLFSDVLVGIFKALDPLSQRFFWDTCLSSVFTWRHGGHVGGVNKETAAILEEWNILLGIELYFYANSSFCFIMQIWLLVTWANTLHWYLPSKNKPQLNGTSNHNPLESVPLLWSGCYSQVP